MLQCYCIIGQDEEGIDIRCKKQQEDCWCGPEHKEEYQRKEYGIASSRKQARSLEEMQKRIVEIKQEIFKKLI